MFATTSEILKQIQLGEDSAFELKLVTFHGSKVAGPHRDSMADELAAMANSALGTFVLGVDDKSRALVGIPIDKLDAVETWIRSISRDSIEPPLEYILRKVLVTDDKGDEKALIRIDVPRSLFVHKSPGGYFCRMGSSKRELRPEALARLFQQRSQVRLIRFDEQIVPNSGLDALNLRLANRFRTAMSAKSEHEFLTKLKLASPDEDGTLRLTVGGLLMTCDAPEEFLSNAFIQAVCYRGEERANAQQLDAQDITGPLDLQIRDACKFVARNMRVYAVKAPHRIETPQFSLNAVFEAVVNAVAHRDYSIYGSKIRLTIFSDRLELNSPGMIPNSMTLDSLSERQSTRNELLTSLLAKCPMNVDAFGSQRHFIMDKRGEGVPIIISESKLLSGRRPEFELLDDNELKLTIYAAPSPHNP